MTLQEKIRQAGVVGAGGGGFPADVKAGARVEFVVANGAECEPLIHKDFELMVHKATGIVNGIKLLMEATGAREGIVGIKGKNKRAIDAIGACIGSAKIRIHELGDFYPSGDEYILVYEATGRLIPPQGYPPDVGVLVNNVETLYNISLAATGSAVTEKYITVAGAVKNSVTLSVPVGISYDDAIALAGGAVVKEYAVFSGGLMMGKLETDRTAPVTKTCAGLVVLPLDHSLVVRKLQPESSMHKIGKSACDQCSYCTELCPRYILGYDVQPHKVMRSLGFTKTGESFWNLSAALCCSCGLCTLYACPESLFPKEACDKAKRALKEEGKKWEGSMAVTPHPMYEGRRTPLKQLVRRLGISEYRSEAPFSNAVASPQRVTLPLVQHAGVAARPIVRAGARVRKGDPVGEIPEGKLGARVHASIDGVVKEIDQSIVIERG